MDNVQTIDRKLETIAWGALFIWWGLRWWPLISLPNGTGLLGTGLILLGSNAARSLKSIPTMRYTTILGLFSLVFGGLLLASDVLHVRFELPIFEILLIVLGVILLSRGLVQFRPPSSRDLR
jgi:hypothetical protein